MVFTSPIFLFLFLPVTLAVSFLLPRVLRNLWLLLASIVFYAWGELAFTPILLGAIVLNYGCGLIVGWSRSRAVLALAIAGNLGLLALMKYGSFLAANLNAVLAWRGAAPYQVAPIALPLGISFFTFHAISYLVDVYRGDARPQRNPLDAAVYFLMFPHLIAGPIVRYHHVAEQLARRRVDLAQFALGVSRFIVGLGKKVLVANVLAVPADAVFALPPDQLDTATAWLGVVCYTLQIYFDFSGYSDMAIGLAHMLGFRFRENFDYPYVAQSIREFWRRWHISLSTWFRDYLFIPMGGSRRSAPRVYFNLLTVFVLCGLWHGASWTFVVWGLWHGGFQVIERLGLDRLLARAWRPLRHAYALLVVMLGWVIFRADTFTHALAVLTAMLTPTAGATPASDPWILVNAEVTTALVVAIVGATPIVPWLGRWRATPLAPAASPALDGLCAMARTAVLLMIFVLAAAALSASTYNPFIYYRF